MLAQSQLILLQWDETTTRLFSRIYVDISDNAVNFFIPFLASIVAFVMFLVRYDIV
jgi:hypothetical protein